MRKQLDLKAAVDALTQPRILHTTQPDPRTGQPRVRSIEHPALIDLLENGLGVTGRGSGTGGSGGMPGAVDAGALETWAQIRDQVRTWLKQLRAPWSDDLKADLRLWHEHHTIAAAQGRISGEKLETVERIVVAWQERIERKYDPDERREWTEPCPAVLEHDERTGRIRRCGARRIKLEGTLQFAIALNVTRREAECRACKTRWEGERELIHLRYETNLVDLERTLAEADQHDRSGELALTGPIDLP